MSAGDRDLRLAHERIQDIEALLEGRPLPIRGRLSPLRWILVLAFAFAVGVALPLPQTLSVATSPEPPAIPRGALTLADDARPIYLKLPTGRVFAFVRAWWAGHEVNPLHVVALDPTDWSIMWVSQGFPATAFDRGSLRFDNGSLLLFTSTAPSTRHFYMLTADQGSLISDGPTTTDMATGVGATPPAESVETSNYEYRLRPNSLSHGTSYDRPIQGIGLGSHLGSLEIHGTDLVITANDALFIVDGKNGELKKRIDSF